MWKFFKPQMKGCGSKSENLKANLRSEMWESEIEKQFSWTKVKKAATEVQNDF